MSKHLIKQLISKVKCYKCGEQYDIDNVEILECKDDTWFLNVYCNSCQRQSFIIAIIKTNKELEINTDLTEGEYGKFANAGPVNTDYLLDLHSFLNDFSGDYSELFKINDLESK